MHDYVTRISHSPFELPAHDWNCLLERQAQPTPFMRHEYLSALHRSGSAVAQTGWTPHFVTLHNPESGALQAAAALYAKSHSYGEYVFDWAWANAYAQHGYAYYPKGLVATPFTPVTGSRLLALDSQSRQALLQTLQAYAEQQQWSSIHLLFGSDSDIAAGVQQGWMTRQTVQFHWENQTINSGYQSFDEFLGTLRQEKRKKIKQERRKVADAGVQFRVLSGSEISDSEWDFFYNCYERNYLEHGNAPYLSRSFFQMMAQDLPQHWLLFVGERNHQAVAASLIAISDQGPLKTAWGRYWGALQRVDCLHFEACYYQPIEWCIQNKWQRFEGGAQGEHKLARALMPVATSSAHWLSHPDFAHAVARFLNREQEGIAQYVKELERHGPFKANSG
jgi:predicted N-acyltransferase